MTTYTFQKVTLNGATGWFATKRINGTYIGKMFGKNKAKAVEAFAQE